MLRQVDKINGIIIQKITAPKQADRWQNVPADKLGKGAEHVTPFDTFGAARDAAKATNPVPA